VPRDERILSWFFVPAGKRMKASAGELVRARIISYPSPSGQAEAEIVEILGKELTPKLESRIILRQYDSRKSSAQRLFRNWAPSLPQ